MAGSGRVSGKQIVAELVASSGRLAVNFLIAATLYFATALPELAPHAKFEIWHFYIWHMRFYSDIRAHMRFSTGPKEQVFKLFCR